MYQPFDIVYGRALWRNCLDERPWLIVDVRKGGERYGAFPISTPYYGNAGPCYIIEESDENFAATGLDHRSHLYYESIIELKHEEIRRLMGQLVGALLAAVREIAGL